MSTIKVPVQIPTAIQDCEQLKKAFDGWGTDEASIINILVRRNATQRKLVRQTYREKYGEDLFIGLEKEISGDFLRALHIWTMEPAERDAFLLNESVTKKQNVRHSCYVIILEVACTRTSHQLFLVRQQYLALFNRSLEEDVAHHTTGDFRKLLVPLVTAYRYEGPDVNMGLAKAEAKILHEKISLKAYGDEELFRILTTRGKEQINATLNQYKDQFGNAINKDLKKMNAKDDQHLIIKLLRDTIKCLTYPEKYFEKALRLSVKGCGTDEETLTRIVVTRAEVDMKLIMEEYQRRNSHSLDAAIKADTSGDYQTTLLALIGL